MDAEIKLHGISGGSGGEGNAGQAAALDSLLSNMIADAKKAAASSSTCSPEHTSTFVCDSSSTSVLSKTVVEEAKGTSDAKDEVVEMRVANGTRLGERLVLKTANLKLLLGCLENLHQSCTGDMQSQPHSIAFTPEGMFITICVPNEGRTHSLSLPTFFFGEYRCISTGFRVNVDFNKLISILTNIYSAHTGRCVKILDKPDNTLLVHGLLDDHRFCDEELKTYANVTASEPILQAAYYRFPFMIKLKTDWLHNIFKRMQQKSEVIIEFNGETRYLEFLSTMDGERCCEGGEIQPDHILQNPFLTRKSNNNNNNNKESAKDTHIVDTHIVYTNTKKVTELAQDTVPESAYIGLENGGTLKSFRYRAQFSPRSIWLAVKRNNKVGTFLYLYLAPGLPILFQYVLQYHVSDSRCAATYDTWIRASEKIVNPLFPTGSSDLVVRRMLELAPQLGSNDHTFRIGTMAVEQTTGYIPTEQDKIRMLDLAPPQPQTPPTNDHLPKDKENENEKKNENENEKKERPATETRSTAKGPKKRKTVELDANGLPIKKKRGRPPKSKPATTPPLKKP